MRPWAALGCEIARLRLRIGQLLDRQVLCASRAESSDQPPPEPRIRLAIIELYVPVVADGIAQDFKGCQRLPSHAPYKTWSTCDDLFRHRSSNRDPVTLSLFKSDTAREWHLSCVGRDHYLFGLEYIQDRHSHGLHLAVSYHCSRNAYMAVALFSNSSICS